MCNHEPEDLDALASRTEVVPAVNQVELHPSFQQRALRAFHEEHGILTQAWAPIGGSVRRFTDQGRSSDPLKDGTIAGIAARHGKTPAQVTLRWHLQNGVSAIPKSFNSGRIAENFDVFDFELSAEDMAEIDALDLGVRSGPDPETLTATTFDIKLED